MGRRFFIHGNWVSSQSICRDQFELENLYQKHQIRLRHSRFIVYLLAQAFLSSVTIAMECIALPAEDLAEVVMTHGIVLAVCLLLLFYIYNEKLFLSSSPSLGNHSKRLGDPSVSSDEKSRSSWVPKASTAFVFVPLFAMQIVMATAHANGRDFTTHWDWSLYMVLVCYIFFPLRMPVSAVLAIVVSLVPVFTSIFEKSSREVGDRTRRVMVDFFVMLAGNGVGLFFCFMTEIALRKSFLDKREFIVAKCMREYEEKTEKHLLSSIIPAAMVEELRKSLREAVVANRRDKEYSIVPILPSLSAKPYEKFDEAVKEFDCLRIKLLGDCYNCVSGVPEWTEKHAVNCVLLGLKMIAIIREVRCVHISEATHAALGKKHRFYFEPGRKDSYLEKKGIVTFFIPLSQNRHLISVDPCISTEEIISVQRPTSSQPLLPNSHEAMRSVPDGFHWQRRSENGAALGGTNRRENDILVAKQGASTITMLMEEAQTRMEEDLDKMPLSIHAQWLQSKEIQPTFIAFRDLKLEWDFMRQPDMLIKYTVSAATCLVVFLGIVEILSRPETVGIVAWAMVLSVMLAITFWAWIGSVYAKWMRWKDSQEQQEPLVWKKAPRRLIVSPWIRILLFLVTGSGAILVAAVSHIVRCTEIGKCAYTRSLTQEFALVLCTIFVFYHIHFLLKLGAMVVALGVYGIVGRMRFHDRPSEWNENSVSQEDSSLLPHLHYLVYSKPFSLFFFPTSFLHDDLIPQSEYLFKLDYKWKKSLPKEQEEAELAREVNRSLIFNILPTHLAERYLHQKREKELYHERYQSAAVMFATILNFWPEEDGGRRRWESGAENDPKARIEALAFLNGIISDIDRVLSSRIHRK
ncbi:unnamed protein product [Darwinula stevensoni]|uniref:adenylate cyclase n=1 Tax=Darwinula stevensoni TaxID=69355 RepID=A0A7R9A0Y2_9CRUS|nr:unnamed protein product [Darwinula stevensoni]CAG0886552.1 unnamed protein product [Darwinula stevensoni]